MNKSHGLNLSGAKVSSPLGKEAGSSPRERVRSLVQAEVARANPADTARRSLELIVETSVRAREENGELRVTVVDDAGQVRMQRHGDESAPLTIAEYIEELRHKHPTLFKPRAAPPAAAPIPSAAPSPAATAEAEAAPLAAALPHRRDWLDLGRERPEHPAESEEAAAPPAATGKAKARFGSVAQAGVAAIGAAGPLMLRSVGRMRDSWRMRRAQAAVARPAAVHEAVPAPVMRSRRWLPAVGAIAGVGALLVAGALLIPQMMDPADAPVQVASPSTPAPASAPPREPTTTGAIAAPPAATPAGPLRGIPEVLDTSTLRLQDRVVRLFGVEWARGGGDPDDLVKYLRGREVSCDPAGMADTYRCQVEGQDLSRVVLFNGGGRTTSDASPELRAAEEHARSQRIGVWKENRPPAP